MLLQFLRPAVLLLPPPGLRPPGSWSPWRSSTRRQTNTSTRGPTRPDAHEHEEHDEHEDEEHDAPEDKEHEDEGEKPDAPEDEEHDAPEDEDGEREDEDGKHEDEEHENEERDLAVTAATLQVTEEASANNHAGCVKFGKDQDEFEAGRVQELETLALARIVQGGHVLSLREALEFADEPAAQELVTRFSREFAPVMGKGHSERPASQALAIAERLLTIPAADTLQDLEALVRRAAPKGIFSFCDAWPLVEYVLEDHWNAEPNEHE